MPFFDHSVVKNRRGKIAHDKSEYFGFFLMEIASMVWKACQKLPDK